jgi:gamma-glutamylcyclotransferase (GGCT)/AIG2-like uncharacterized protein YtfP
MEQSSGWTRGGWRSPAGIGTIAAVVGVIIAAIALFMTPGDGEDGPTSTDTYYFVYGTTMPGHLRYELIEDFVAKATRASVTGRLYDSGSGYPAAKFSSSEDAVEGYLLRIRPDRLSEAKRTFTAMESGLFEPVEVQTDDGTKATAFEWIGSIDGLERLNGMWDRPEA